MTWEPRLPANDRFDRRLRKESAWTAIVYALAFLILIAIAWGGPILNRKIQEQVSSALYPATDEAFMASYRARP